MPTYAYACTACGHELEAVQSIADPALTTCPECTGPLRKVFHPVGVTFKGSGFYRTDSRSGGGSAKAGGSGKPAGEGKPSSESTSTAAPAPSSATAPSKASSTSGAGGSGS